MNNKTIKLALLATLLLGTQVAVEACNDGSKEEGFVNPPAEKVLPPAPPRTVSSAETFIPGGCTTPMSRSEAKKPPRPPVLVTKVTD